MELFVRHVPLEHTVLAEQRRLAPHAQILFQATAITAAVAVQPIIVHGNAMRGMKAPVPHVRRVQTIIQQKTAATRKTYIPPADIILERVPVQNHVPYITAAVPAVRVAYRHMVIGLMVRGHTCV